MSLGEAIALGVSVVGTVLGVVGVWLTIKSKIKKRMAYQTNEITLVGQPDPNPSGEITILFNGSRVPRVVVTKVVIWNAGNTTVRGTDIVPSDPLAINFGENAIILGSRRLKEIRPVNDFHIKLADEKNSRALFEFDYLDSNDGASFEILHTGQKQSASITGTVRGIPGGIENWGRFREDTRERSNVKELYGIGITFLLGVAMILLVTLQESVSVKHPLFASILRWLGISVGFLVGLLVIAIIVFGISMTLYYNKFRGTPKAFSRN